ncbi:MAG: hypothetical protein ACYDCK_04180 [Thermoplasmatota archaeon]
MRVPHRAAGIVPRAPLARLAALALLLPALLAGCVHRNPLDDVKGDFSMERTTIIGTENATLPVGNSPLPETAAWHTGDVWYYESNNTNYQEIVVRGYGRVPSGPLKGRLVYDVSQLEGVIGGPVLSSFRMTVDARTFGIINMSIDGGRTVYSPANPSLRFLHDGVFFYNESGAIHTPVGDRAWLNHFVVRVNRAEDRPLLLPAGHFNTSHFRLYTTEYGSNSQQAQFLFTERIWSPDVLNDVILITNDKEIFKLVWYSHDGVAHGIEPTWLTHG